MKTRMLWLIVSGVALFLLGVGLAGARPFGLAERAVVDAPMAMTGVALDSNQDNDGPDAQAVVSDVADTITYQGRVTNAAGQPLNGTNSMRFLLYDVPTGGTPLWDTDNMSVDVDNGLFSVDLDVNQADFNGQALWLRIDVNGQTLSPRQPLHPSPYALNLKPGADIIAQTLLASAPATGTAVRAQAGGGEGLWASSNNTYAVQGSSDQSWGGYFTSNEGYGIVVSTGGDDHWDHAGVFESQTGYGVYVTSSNNMAVRGESGDMTDLWQPVGHVGLVGLGQSRGVYGSSNSSYGVYATSLNWYGVYGRTSRGDDNYGLYTPDNMFANSYQSVGAFMNVAQNNGDEPLNSGDVVVFNGMSEPLSANGSPVIQVARATEANSHAVAGVVHSRFNIDAATLEDEDPAPDLEVTPAGPAQPGDYLLVVVQGPAQVRASAVEEAIQPGDLLATGGGAGLAGKAPLMALDDVQTAVPGTVFAKALEPLSEGQELIYVFVTLQ